MTQAGKIQRALKRLIKGLALALGTVVLVVAIGGMVVAWYVSGPQLTALINQQLNAHLRGHFTIGAATYRFPNTLTLKDIHIADPAGEDVARAAELHASLAWLHTVHSGMITVDPITVTSGWIMLRPMPTSLSNGDPHQQDGDFGLVAAFLPRPTANPPARPTQPAVDPTAPTFFSRWQRAWDQWYRGIALNIQSLRAITFAWASDAQQLPFITVDDALVDNAQITILRTPDTVQLQIGHVHTSHLVFHQETAAPTRPSSTSPQSTNTKSDTGLIALGVDAERVQMEFPAHANSTIDPGTAHVQWGDEHVRLRGHVTLADAPSTDLTADVTLQGDPLRIAGIPVHAVHITGRYVDQPHMHQRQFTVDGLDVFLHNTPMPEIALHGHVEQHTTTEALAHDLTVTAHHVQLHALFNHLQHTVSTHATASQNPWLPQFVDGTLHAVGSDLLQPHSNITTTLQFSGIPHGKTHDVITTHLQAALRRNIIQLQRADINTPYGTAHATARIALPKDARHELTFSSDVRIDPINTTTWIAPALGVPITGKISAQGTLSGTRRMLTDAQWVLNSPGLTLTQANHSASTHHITLNVHAAGPWQHITTDAQLHVDDLLVTHRSKLTAKTLDATLHAVMDRQTPKAPYPDLEAAITATQLHVGETPVGDGTLHITVHKQNHARAYHVQADLPPLLHASGSVQPDPLLAMATVDIKHDPTSAALQIKAQLTPDHIEAAAHGVIDLRILPDVSEAFRAADGIIQVQATAHGTPRNPNVRGVITWAEPLTLHARAYHAPVQMHSGTITVTPEMLAFDTIEGTLESGTFTLQGTIDMLPNRQPRRYDLHVLGHNLPVDLPELTLEANTDITLHGEGMIPSMRGRIDVIAGRYTKQFTLKDFNFISREPDVSVPLAERMPWLSQMQLDLRVISAENFDMNIDAGLMGVQLVLGVDLTVAGTPLRPDLKGRIAASSGRLRFPSAKLDVASAIVTFAPNANLAQRTGQSIADQTYVTLQANGDIITQQPDTGLSTNYMVTTTLHGTVDHLQLELSADPYLDRFGVLALLITGQADLRTLVGQGSTASSTTSSNSKLNTALILAGSQLTSPVTNFVEAQLDSWANLQIDLGAQLSQSGVRFSAAKSFTPRLRLQGWYQKSLKTSSTADMTGVSAQLLITDDLFVEGSTTQQLQSGAFSAGNNSANTTRVELKYRLLGK